MPFLGISWGLDLALPPNLPEILEISENFRAIVALAQMDFPFGGIGFGGVN